ncbi:hypothetical protein Tsubulata_021509 [Turnera subulata]|uniref:Uncharacterized protein n=1 Tax=Turnera subulata TaxID=218843 RepID=A0A9Q0JCP9_9ROSI|nr:hypothetical protein Tsubulata_021509 [Turnera subulata]
MKKKINLMLRKCKSLSRQLGRSSSYSSLRSHSTREFINVWGGGEIRQEADDHIFKEDDEERHENILVGSTRKPYLINSKYLSHPLVAALIEKSSKQEEILVVRCEVVFFDHLLWMLENADPNAISLDSLEELAHLYML